MALHTDEQEQVEALKLWWKENRNSVLLGLALGVAIILGGQSWFQHKHQQSELASALYEQMMQDVSADKKEDAKSKAGTLIGQYDNTPYAVMAALQLAKMNVEQNDLVGARGQLQWALDHAPDKPTEHVVRLRLARVLLAANLADQAMQLLNGVDMGHFTAAYEELKGDIYVVQGQQEQARSAYQSALLAGAVNGQGQDYLQMKLDDLGPGSAPIALGETKE